MAGAAAQAGFYYQNLVAALHALDLIEIGSPLRTLTLENPTRAKHIDDVILDYADLTQFVQVKWSDSESSAFTLGNLAAAEADSTSLIAKLAIGFRKVAGAAGRKEVILLSTKKVGTNRQVASGWDKSLDQFINEFHQPFFSDHSIDNVESAPNFGEYASVLDALLIASGLRDRAELSRFLKCLRFKLGEPDRETLIERVRFRLERLGIEQVQYGTLLDELVKWSIDGREIHSEDILRVLGLRDRFIENLNHHFPVDDNLWIPTPKLFDALEASVGAVGNGFVLVQGEPGSGKSTALTKYLSLHSDVRFGYFCYVPNDTSIGNERLGDDAFVRSICIGLKNAFPNISFPKPYAPHTVGLLNEWLAALSAQSQRVVFIVDGLDHVDRKTKQSLIAQPLTSVLDGTLPSNVIIVLSSRYPEALPPPVLRHIQNDSRRSLIVPSFDRDQVRQFLRVRGVSIAEKLLDVATEISGGVPIYLEYLASQLERMSDYQQERYLESVPTLRDKKIDYFHQHLWDQCTGDESLIYLLAIFAIRDEFTTPETLQKLMQFVGVQITLAGVHSAISSVRHVLRASDAKGWSIRHSSLVEFVLEKTSDLRTEITKAMLTLYAEDPTTDEAWKHQFRHLLAAQQYTPILDACTDAWLKQAWAFHRPIEEIQRNLDIAWQAATAIRDIVQFARIGLLKQQAALIQKNLEYSETKVADLLLDMGLTEVALTRVWNGARRTCDLASFAEFSLMHRKRTGRSLPENILNLGLGADVPKAKFDEIKSWYRGRSQIGNGLDLLRRASETRWRNSDDHKNIVDAADEKENRRLNGELQYAVVKELIEHGAIETLEMIRDSTDLASGLKQAGAVGAALVYARASEISESLKIMETAETHVLPDEFRRWATLEFAMVGVFEDGLTDKAVPPTLPVDLVDKRHEFNTDFIALYDELRYFFLKSDTGIPWFQSATSGMAEPAKSLVSAIGRLAQLWLEWVQGKNPSSRLADVSQVIDGLDPPLELFGSSSDDWNHANYAFRRSAHRLLKHVWIFAADALTEAEITKVAKSWMRGGDQSRAFRYVDATRELAIAMHSRYPHTVGASISDLMSIAERNARSDEETTQLVAGLTACAAAWGRCGYFDNAQSLWEELPDIACGVHSRKDYQFNEIMPVLELAHAHDPARTLDRISEQLVLAHQLEETGASRSVALAVEALLEFLAEIHPPLTLKGLIHEEKIVFRDRAIGRVVDGLIKGGGDHHLILVLVTTMSKWEDYRSFNDAMLPTMRSLFSAALHAEDKRAAEDIYKFGRQLFLVEKERPQEVRRWATEWKEQGDAPSYVIADHSNLPIEATASDETSSSMSAKLDPLPADIDDLAARDLNGLEKRLDALSEEELQEQWGSQVDRSRDDWMKAALRASGKEWSEEQSSSFHKCFDWFRQSVISKLTLGGLAARAAIQELVPEFAAKLSEELCIQILDNGFTQYFALEDWLDGLVRPRGAPYSLSQKIEGRLSEWVADARLSDISAWNDLCRRRLSDEVRASGLLAVAKRMASTRPLEALECLAAAAAGISQLLFEHTRLARDLFTLAFELDREKGLELLLNSFRQQFRRFPEMIVHRLDIVLELGRSTSTFDAVKMYDVWAAYNKRLTAGLSKKEVDLNWLRETEAGDFSSHCVAYLIAMFDYPVIDNRLLAVDALVKLLSERTYLIEGVLNSWSTLSDGQKEYLASSLASLGLLQPASVHHWGEQLVKFGASEMHYNLRKAIAEAVLATPGASDVLNQSTLQGAQQLSDPPQIVLKASAPIFSKPATRIRLPPYLGWTKKQLANFTSPPKLDVLTFAYLSQQFPGPENGMEIEAEEHRTYNINTNFDIIEIGGRFDRAMRSSLNRAVYALLQAHDFDVEGLHFVDDLLRIRDPSDSLIARTTKPPQLDWLAKSLSDKDFISFTDAKERESHLPFCDGDWITLFEYTEQRESEHRSAPQQRVNKSTVTIFGLSKGVPDPTLEEVLSEMRGGALQSYRNLYRTELSMALAHAGISRIKPITVHTRRSFRGRQTAEIAAILRPLLDQIAAEPATSDFFGWYSEGEQIIRSVDWQEQYDQDRRRHEPQSAGYLLQIKRETLAEIGRKNDLDFWGILLQERTNEKYKPEYEMKWHEHQAIFRLN